MDHSATFARHFARLVALLLHDAENRDEQKMSLRALATINKSGAVKLTAQEWRLLANDQPVPAALMGVQDVASQMAAHSIASIDVGAKTSAADLLALARILAAPATPGDGGAQVRQTLATLGAKTIDIVTSAPIPVVVAHDAPTVVAAADASRVARDAVTLLSQLAAPDVSKLSHRDLLTSLDLEQNAHLCAKVLDDLLLVAEHAMRAGKTAAVGEILHGIVFRESRQSEGEVKRAYQAAIRRMSKPALLRAVATLIPKRPEGKQAYCEVLNRTGEEGADAVIEQITQAPTNEDRKALLEVFRELSHAVPALKRMLGDSRWFVVRNAADLLGEMAATDAESNLVALLKHSDERVRRAATNALLRLGTPDAMKGIYEAMSDTSPEVRIQATAALATKRDGKTSHTLIRAIEEEEDGDVQIAMIAALGRIATPDAVQKLIKMAEPEGRLFRKKSTLFRVAAVQALGEARTPAAFAALRDLTGDKDREVRETATRALAHAAR
jgi:HEAT repeat protein